MTKANIPQYSATAASNTDVQDIDIAENCAPSGINNAIREIMADLKDQDTGAVAMTSPVLTTADINGGTVDNVTITGGTADNITIGGSTPAAGTFTTVTTSGEITANGGIALGDNDKATFGAGDDLQIYHNASDSFVSAVGTGDLIIQTSTDDKDVKIKSDDGAGGLVEYFRADGSLGQASMFYYGSKKLNTTNSGIEVTGDITASDGVYVGGTGAANLLDDYEEGSYTVELYDAASGGNASSTSVTGYYTKIGNQVTVRFDALNNISTAGMNGTTNVFITLPFYSSSTGRSIGSVAIDNLSFTTNRTVVAPLVVDSVIRAQLITTGADVTDVNVDVEDINSGSTDIHTFTLTYFTS